MPLNAEETMASKIRAMQFQASPVEERLKHFDEVAGDMCSDEWRKKFREFVEKFPPDVAAKDEPLFIEISEHSFIERSLFEKPEEIPGCRQCRDAFWKLVSIVSQNW